MKLTNHFPCSRHAAFRAVLLATAGVLLNVAQVTAQDGMKDAQNGSAAMKRDPFWPVGYIPADVQVETGPAPAAASERSQGGNSWNEAMKRVVINGVSSRSDSEYFAVINGEVKSVGDTVSVVLGNSTYTWAVDRIEPPGSVKLRRVSVR